jgi:hypothetical protein
VPYAEIVNVYGFGATGSDVLAVNAQFWPFESHCSVAFSVAKVVPGYAIAIVTPWVETATYVGLADRIARFADRLTVAGSAMRNAIDAVFAPPPWLAPLPLAGTGIAACVPPPPLQLASITARRVLATAERVECMVSDLIVVSN